MTFNLNLVIKLMKSLVSRKESLVLIILLLDLEVLERTRKMMERKSLVALMSVANLS